MNKADNKGILWIIEVVSKVILIIMLIFNAFLFVYFGLISRSDVLDDDAFRFIESWTVEDSEGNTFPTGRSYVAPKGDDKDYTTIYATLPEGIRDNEYLFFTTRKDVEVYVGGELRKDFVDTRDVNIPGGSVKKFYMMVPLSEKDSGKEVRIIRTSEAREDEVVSEAFVSTRFEAFRYLVKLGGLSFFLAGIVLILSLVVCIVSIVLKYFYKMKIDMLYGSLGILIISAWVLTDSFLFPFIFGVFHVNGIMNYILCLMIPFAPALYLNSVQRGRYKKSLTFVLIVSGLNAVVWPLLHFIGVLPFYNIRIIANLLLILMTVIALSVLVIDALKKKIGEYKYTFIGFLGFLICCIAELMIILLVTATDESLPMVAGLIFLLVFVVIQQIDDLRKINQEKQHAIEISEAKTKFLASMSHEIRTPINAILGMNEMVLRENQDKVIDDYSRSIKSSGKMLLMLVNDVLDFSKIEAGKLEINETGFLMSEMLFDVVSLVKERADEKGLILKTELTGDVPDKMISDEFRIRQILVNLINNAVKYTERGTVTLSIGGNYTDDGFELHLSVKDTGKGIRKEDQPHLFEAFSRADEKANANIEGTGLGLAIVKSIVDSMKGSVGVESEYGVGSEFWVKLPVRYESKDPVPEDFLQHRTAVDAAPAESAFTAPSAAILAVDDNQSNLTIVKLFLKRTGIVPDLCNSGKRAIELCKKKKYDLILLDHMMPQPDGIETLRIIRNDPDSLNQETKAVVLTANAVSGSRQIYMDAGFEDYLTKPLDSSVLEQTVKTLLPKEKVIEAGGGIVRGTPRESGEISGRVMPETEGKKENLAKMGADEVLEFRPESPSEKEVGDVMEFRPGSPSEKESGDVMEFMPGDSDDAESEDVMEFHPKSRDYQDSDELMEFSPVSSKGQESDAMEFSPISSKKHPTQNMSPIRKRLTAIEGLDYDTALHFCGEDESFLAEVVSDTVSECAERAARMRKNLQENEIKAYEIDAHTIKSNMATLGLMALSERAKRHEFAAKDNDIEFILGDANGFIDEYIEVCRMMKG